MEKLISIIIPIYNQADVILRSLNTALNQTYRPIEIIIVNDGSVDNFKDLENKLLRLAQENSISLQIFHQKNSGAPTARNRGFSESKGEYVIFWDADTLAQPDMLKKMYQALQDHPAASFAYGQYKLAWKIMKSQVFNTEDLKKYNYIDTGALIRRVDFPGFDESLKRFQDWDIWLTMVENGKNGVFIPEVLKQMVVNKKGMSSWLPSFVYKLPFKISAVKKYETAREVVLKKHKLF